MNKYELLIPAVRGSITEAVTRDLIIYGQIGSTMDVADRMIANGTARSGVTIMGLEQTDGKGRAGSAWQSLAGNVMVNRIVRLFQGECGAEIEMLAGLTITEVGQDLLPGRNVVQKYPNGAKIDGCKFGGCLVWPFYDSPAYIRQNTLSCGEGISQEKGSRLISVGVGVNVGLVPKNLSQAVTSLAAEGAVVSIAGFMERFDRKFDDILSEYRQCQDFTVMFKRMGYLDSKNKLTVLENGTRSAKSGKYRGFVVKGEGKNSVSYLRLRTASGIDEVPVRELEMVAAMPPDRDALFHTYDPAQLARHVPG